MHVKIKKLTPTAIVPTYATYGAACFDLYADKLDEQFSRSHVDHDDPLVCGTGLSFEVPAGHVMLIFSRSGHGFKHGVRLANCVGVIDSDYRGEVKVKLTADEAADKLLIVSRGDRVAQAMIVPVQRATFIVSDELSETERGAGGFGSTGV